MASIPPMPMSERKIIARRAALELKANSVVNLGIGMPEGIANVADEENDHRSLTLTAEPGVIGGIPAGGLNFGAAINTQAIIDQPSQFDFYDGGGLDVAFLGMAQADREGNVNVSKFGPQLAGAGGFINISQNAKKLVFVGTFTAGELQIRVADGRLHIVRKGRRTSSSKRSSTGLSAVTMRRSAARRCSTSPSAASSAWPKTDVELTEIAPGVDLEKDILAHMSFRPIIRGEPRLMDRRIFDDAPMRLRNDLVRLPLDDRLAYDPDQNVFFLNFERLAVRSRADIEEINRHVRAKLEPLGRKVFAIVNYDDFEINPELMDEYAEMVREVMERHYLGVTRYTTSAFLRLKLGEFLSRRQVAPHIYESVEEARIRLTMDTEIAGS